MHIYRHEMELPAFGEHINPQHAVVFGHSAPNRDAAHLVDDHRDRANHRAGRMAVLVRLAQRVGGRKGLVGFAAMGFQPGADRRVQLGVAVRVRKAVDVFERQVGERHFLRDAPLFDQA